MSLSGNFPAGTCRRAGGEANVAAQRLVQQREDGDYMHEQLEFLVREFYSGHATRRDQQLFHSVRRALLERFRNEPGTEAR